MRASAISRTTAASFKELKPVCQVLVLHEDFSAYSRAVEVYRRVMERFASELDFDIKCWNFIELADPNCARHAAKTASSADIILVSMLTAQTPQELDRWLDFFFVDRLKAQGLLGLLWNSSDSPPTGAEKLLLRMEQLAEGRGLDFISMRPGDAAAIVASLPVAILSRAVGE